MSLTIRIPKVQLDFKINKNKDSCCSEGSYNSHAYNVDSISLEEQKEIASINFPKNSLSKANDLSKLEVSMTSSKFSMSVSLSADDENSNISNDSAVQSQQNQIETEIKIKNIDHINTPVKHEKSNTSLNNSNNNFSSSEMFYDINKLTSQNSKK
jgi:hypothetical protein